MDHLPLQTQTGNQSEIETGKETDWISHLPEFIIHRILSFLIPWEGPPVELVRMSVLSKKWSDLTSSFQHLDFCIDDFASRDSFFKYVEYTVSRFCRNNIPALMLRLVTTLVEPQEVDVVNRCIELVVKNGVRELDIDITNSSEEVPEAIASVNPMRKCRLPDMLLSVSALRSLIITGCELPSSLMVDGVKFKCLIHLVLKNVPIDDEVSKYLVTSCPLLEVLHIKNCRGLKRIGVYGHQNLQNVSVDCTTEFERIDIEAPNLSSLWVADRYVRGAPPMNVALCKKLTTVSYFGHCLPNDFLSSFPFVEHLVFATLSQSRNLKLSSYTLKTLALESACDLDDIEFRTPNLVIFIYASKYCYWPMIMDNGWSLLKDSTHLKGCMQCYPGSDMNILWFLKFRRFLDKKDVFKVLNLYIQPIYNQYFTDLKRLNEFHSPPYELDHVELQLDPDEELSAHIDFVGAVLWCCRPRSLTLRYFDYLSDFEEQVKVGMFTYQKLLEQEPQGNTKMQFVGPSACEAQKQLMYSKSLSTALIPDRSAMCFIKEKVVQEVQEEA